jgi:hypothetical protein
MKLLNHVLNHSYKLEVQSLFINIKRPQTTATPTTTTTAATIPATTITAAGRTTTTITSNITFNTTKF